MSGVRRYDDESWLDDMVCPPEPPQTPIDQFMKQWEADRKREEMAAHERKEAREKRSRDFDISKGSAKGESPEEEY